MDWLSILATVIALMLIITGLIGSFFPVVPALPIIFVGVVIYGFVDSFSQITWQVLVSIGIVMLLAWIMQQLASAYGAKKMGSSRWGILGAFIGSLVAILTMSFLGPFGFAIWPFVLAVIFELIAGRSWQRSLKAGLGGLIGVLGGLFMQIVAALVMVLIFIIAII